MSWDELRGPLAEAAGGQVLGELLLDTKLEQRLAAASLRVGDADVQRERDLLAASLASAGVTPDQATQLIEDLRAQRGLGAQRYQALLRRNAMLRALVGPAVRVDEGLIEQAYETRYGEQAVVRIIVTPDLASAQRLRDRLVAAGPSAMAFAEVAARESIDASAPAGGLIEAFSPRDTRYPAALRAAVAGLKVGELSPVFAVGAQAGVVLLQERRPASGTTLAGARDELTSQLRLGLERQSMDQLAKEIMDAAQVSVMDRSLQWSWERARAR